jgi:glycine/D-amino acid oxidase-like deaminating enzyme
MASDVDVAIIGGGTAGAIAAIQAGRLGARTLLVEKSGILGGTTTLAGVALPGLFHAWGEQVIAGIGWELVSRSVELEGASLPDFTDYRRPHYKLQVPVNPTIYASLLDDAVVDAGVDLRLHTMLAGVREVDDGWSISLCSKEGLTEVRAAVLVDCTGDGDAIGQAGLERLSDPEPQPGTLMAYVDGYDYAALDLDALDRALAVAVAAGEVESGDFASTVRPVGKFLRGHGQNSMHVVGIGGATSVERTRAEVAARRTLMRIYRFLRTQPGLETIKIRYSATQVGVRESFTARAHESITVDDYTSGRMWDDAIAYSFYPVDVHQHDGDGIDIRPLAEGVVATIPLGAMIPVGSDRVVVAGRLVAGDQEANSAYRVQASSMATGQAAGAVAALAVRLGCPIADVPLENLRTTLREHGAIVPPGNEQGPISAPSIRKGKE